MRAITAKQIRKQCCRREWLRDPVLDWICRWCKRFSMGMWFSGWLGS